MRMLFAWFVICANAELPNAEFCVLKPAHCTSLNRFSTSRRIDADWLPTVRKLLLTDRSTLFRIGESTPGSVRGALPNWLAGAAWKAAGFRYRLSAPAEALIRSVISPDARIG